MPGRSALHGDDERDTLAVDQGPGLEAGRLGVYAALGAYVGAVPLPWVPHALARRVRGALVQDVAARHGRSLSPEARAILADTSSPEDTRGLASKAMQYVGWKMAARTLSRLGPLGVVWPLRHALQTYALGHLFDRYLAATPSGRPVRVDATEALRVRKAVDAALVRAIAVEAPLEQEPGAIDDQRDATTALVDGMISLTASVPGRLVRRLDAAFDELVARTTRRPDDANENDG